MNGRIAEPHTPGPCRVAAARRQTPQGYPVEAGEEGQIPKTPENWRDELLASGPDRGVHFEVELGSMTVVKALHDDAITGRRVRFLEFHCPVGKHDDLAACETKRDRYLPKLAAGQ